MAKYEATQGDWKRVVGKLPGELTKELPEGDGSILMSLGYFTLCLGGETAKPHAVIDGQRYEVAVENFIAGRHQQQIALRRHAQDFERAQFRKMLRGELIFGAGVQIALHADVASQQFVGLPRRVHQCGAQTVLLHKVCRVIAAE
mgnify:CR=1 FL=1